MTKDEEIALRELAAGQCTIQKVVDALGPLSLWSDKALKAEIHEAVLAEREACAKEAEKTFYSVQAAENIRARGKA